MYRPAAIRHSGSLRFKSSCCRATNRGAIGSSRPTVGGESRSGRLKNAIGNYFERIVVFVRM
jgi:hypothetical protein